MMILLYILCIMLCGAIIQWWFSYIYCALCCAERSSNDDSPVYTVHYVVRASILLPRSGPLSLVEYIYIYIYIHLKGSGTRDLPVCGIVPQPLGYRVPHYLFMLCGHEAGLPLYDGRICKQNSRTINCRGCWKQVVAKTWRGRVAVSQDGFLPACP
jgi:hypothetical protein